MSERASVADAANLGREFGSPTGRERQPEEPRRVAHIRGEPVGHGGTFLSLFSGIGGLDLALEALGWRCVGQVEWDPWCSEQLARHWPTVPRWSDVREFGAEAFDAAFAQGAGRGLRVPPDHGTLAGDEHALGNGDQVQRRVDLICGGFPCQPLSFAGKRKGRDDARWLWPEFARIVRVLRPRIVVVENVPGILAPYAVKDDDDRIIGWHAAPVEEVLGDLAAMGFDAEWGSLRASDIGAPHRRERFFLVAYTEGLGRQRSRPAREWWNGFANGADAYTDLQRHEERGLHEVGGTDLPDSAGSGGSDEASGLAAADALNGGRTRRPPHAGREAIERESAAGNRQGTRWGPYEPAIRRWERVMGPAPAPLEHGRLSADFVEWMMAFPHGWTEGKRNARLKALGNAVVWPQAALAFSLLGLSTSLDSEGGEGGNK